VVSISPPARRAVIIAKRNFWIVACTGSSWNKFVKWVTLTHTVQLPTLPGTYAFRQVGVPSGLPTRARIIKKGVRTRSPPVRRRVCARLRTSVIKDKIEESDQELVFYCQFNTWSFTLACSLSLARYKISLIFFLHTLLRPYFYGYNFSFPENILREINLFNTHTVSAHFFARA
jgi:hypothetical protein